ncbi:mitochondrial import receptor protein [Tulasnella sp. 403]|nr:mitochondrial import receptor protein [Tulasnella sp. 403]
MVKVEEIKEQTSSNHPYANSDASSSTDSLASVSTTESLDDDTANQESFFERVSALVDIVPPKTRKNISDRVSSTASFLSKSGKFVGNLVWIVTTSALLVGLPLALSLEDEAKILAQEREAEGQREGQAMLANPAFYPQATPAGAAPQGGLVPPGF